MRNMAVLLCTFLDDNVVGLTQVAEMPEKNLDLMRTEMVGVLKNSSMAFVRELVGADPVALFLWLRILSLTTIVYV